MAAMSHFPPLPLAALCVPSADSLARHICPLKDHGGTSILLRRPFQNLPPPAIGKHLQISGGKFIPCQDVSYLILPPIYPLT